MSRRTLALPFNGRCIWISGGPSNSQDDDWCVRPQPHRSEATSPTQDLPFDPSLGFRPRLELDCSRLDCSDATLNLRVPHRLGVRIGRAVKAGEQFRGRFGAHLRLEAQRVSEHRLDTFRHGTILRLAPPANKTEMKESLGPASMLSPCSVRAESASSGEVVPHGQFRNYSVYGFCLRSEIPLPHPEPDGEPAPDVTFSMQTARWFDGVKAAIPQASLSIGWYDHALLQDGSVFVRWPGYCEFVVSPDGRTVACAELEESTAEWFRTYLLGVVLSFALLKQGHEPLHATVVVVDGKGIAFFGDSGWGKSTLAASFLQAGHTVLTDDLLIIREVDGILYGYPGPSRIKLFLDVARRFQKEKITDEPTDPDSEKLILQLARHEVRDRPVPLHRFFFLDEPQNQESGLSIRTLSPREAFLAVVGASFNRRVTSPDRLQRQFVAAREWSRRLPVRRISYPRTLPMLEAVREAVIADLTGSGASLLPESAPAGRPAQPASPAPE